MWVALFALVDDSFSRRPDPIGFPHQSKPSPSTSQ
jgi:hypothetical protein